MKRRVMLDSETPSDIALKLLEFMMSIIKGQDKAVIDLVDAIDIFESGLFADSKPIYVGLCAGPSGVGKTLTAELLAEYWFGSRKAITKIACEEFSESHAIARLIGSPPGYIGHYDPENKTGTPPLLLQESIDQFALGTDPKLGKIRDEYQNKANRMGQLQLMFGKEYVNIAELFNDDGTILAKDLPLLCEKMKKSSPFIKEYLALLPKIQKLAMLYKYTEVKRPKSVILFDEVEKANETLWNIILNIMDKAELRMSDGSVTDFSNSVILLTTNAGSRIIAEILNPNKQLGFKIGGDNKNTSSMDQEIYKRAIEELNRTFKPEFLARVDRISVYRPLGRDVLRSIVDVELRLFQEKILENLPIVLSFDEKVKDFILDEATDKPANGARLVKNKIQRYLRKPLCRLKNRGEIKEGDTIYVTLKVEEGKTRIVFKREEREEGQGKEGKKKK